MECHPVHTLIGESEYGIYVSATLGVRVSDSEQVAPRIRREGQLMASVDCAGISKIRWLMFSALIWSLLD